MNLLLVCKTSNDNPIEQYFFESIGQVPTSMTYIPSKTDITRKYFEKIKDHFFYVKAQVHILVEGNDLYSVECTSIKDGLEFDKLMNLSSGLNVSFLIKYLTKKLK